MDFQVQLSLITLFDAVVVVVVADDDGAMKKSMWQKTRKLDDVLDSLDHFPSTVLESYLLDLLNLQVPLSYLMKLQMQMKPEEVVVAAAEMSVVVVVEELVVAPKDRSLEKLQEH